MRGGPRGGFGRRPMRPMRPMRRMRPIRPVGPAGPIYRRWWGRPGCGCLTLPVLLAAAVIVSVMAAVL